MNTRLTIKSGKSALLTIVCLGVAIGSFAATPATSRAQGANPYPVGTSAFWAWQNRPDLPANLGAPRDWATGASTQGWPVSAFPRPYSIAVYPPGVLGADPIRGHVALVKQVNNDGSYATTQMDEADCVGSSANCGRINARVMRPAQGVRFIHFQKDTRTTWGFAGGASGWAPVNMDEGAMQGSGWQYKLRGGDPQLVSPRLDIPLDGYNAVEVDMSLAPGIVDTNMQVGFATGNQAQFSVGGSVRGIADGALHTYHISLEGNPNWRGQLAALSLHPAGRNSTGTVRIDRVRLVHDEIHGTMQALTERTVYRCRCTGGAQYY